MAGELPPGPHGPALLGDGALLRLWAPALAHPRVRVGGKGHALRPAGGGFWEAQVAGARAGDRYLFVLDDGRALPDPAARRMPEGVHGPSALWDPGLYKWRHASPPMPRERLVFYELHVGTFTAEGTLDAAVQHLSALAALGITCVELMPVQPFPGTRNWGYDGVALHAVHEAYGGPEGLQRFVDAAHGAGLLVCLDVVFNHLGPEGNYLAPFGPYFTEERETPWGPGVNLDGHGSAAVRDYFIQAALQWVRDFRVDALRLDAVAAMPEMSPRHFVGVLCDAVEALARAEKRQVHVIAEGVDAEDGEVVTPAPQGWGCAALWIDDFHHAVRALLTGERHGRLAPYGDVSMLRRALEGGFGPRQPRTLLWPRQRGSGLAGLPPAHFVSYLQNHDQAANHPGGERLGALVPAEARGALAALVALGPGLPLFFMGEEYGEERPFCFFTSHGDEALAAAVRAGRAQGHPPRPGEELPDPQDPETFRRCVLSHRRDGAHGALWELHRQLLAVRSRHAMTIAAHWPAVTATGRCLILRRPGLELAVNLGPEPRAGLPGFGFRIEER